MTSDRAVPEEDATEYVIVLHGASLFWNDTDWVLFDKAQVFTLAGAQYVRKAERLAGQACAIVPKAVAAERIAIEQKVIDEKLTREAASEEFRKAVWKGEVLIREAIMKAGLGKHKQGVSYLRSIQKTVDRLVGLEALRHHRSQG